MNKRIHWKIKDAGYRLSRNGANVSELKVEGERALYVYFSLYEKDDIPTFYFSRRRLINELRNDDLRPIEKDIIRRDTYTRIFQGDSDFLPAFRYLTYLARGDEKEIPDYVLGTLNQYLDEVEIPLTDVEKEALGELKAMQLREAQRREFLAGLLEGDAAEEESTDEPAVTAAEEPEGTEDGEPAKPSETPLAVPDEPVPEAESTKEDVVKETEDNREEVVAEIKEEPESVSGADPLVTEVSEEQPENTAEDIREEVSEPAEDTVTDDVAMVSEVSEPAREVEEMPTENQPASKPQPEEVAEALSEAPTEPADEPAPSEPEPQEEGSKSTEPVKAPAEDAVGHTEEREQLLESTEDVVLN